MLRGQGCYVNRVDLLLEHGEGKCLDSGNSERSVRGEFSTFHFEYQNKKGFSETHVSYTHLKYLSGNINNNRNNT